MSISFLIFILFISNISFTYNEDIPYSSNITININMIGCHKIYSDNTAQQYSIFTEPAEVFINEIKQGSVQNQYYFNETENIIKLVWYTQINIYNYLFRGCHNITFVDLSNFDSSTITAIHAMFYDCFSLTSINFGQLDTSRLITFRYMFVNCFSLISLNLSNFDISQVTQMEHLFDGCSSISYINLPTIYAYQIDRMEYMFTNCSKLGYLNMNNVIESETKVFSTTDMFKNVPKNLVVCINQTLSPKLYNLIVQGISCATFECSDDNWRYIRKKIYEGACVESCKDINKIDYDGTCIDECPAGTKKLYSTENFCLDKCDFNNYKHEYNGVCFDQCPSGTNDRENEFICIDNVDEITSEISYNNPLIGISSNIDTISEISTINNLIELSSFIDRSTMHLDTYKSEKIHDTEIYTSLKTSVISLISSNKEIYTSQENINIEISSNNQEAIETTKLYNSLEIDNDNENDNLKEIYNDTEIYTIVSEKLLFDYSSEDSESKIIEGNNIIFQITTGKNELELLNNYNSSNNYSLSILDLGDCETILKKRYNINENDSLIFIKQEQLNGKASEKNIQYNVYEPYNKTELNLSLCSGTTINLYVKMEMSNEVKEIYEQAKELGYDIFNIHDPFYNDICTPYKSPDNTDILLSDRIDYIYNNDDSQCQKNCEFSGYLLNSQFINCTCDMNEESNDNEKIEKFNAKKIYESFIDVLKYSNYEIFKCFKLVFSSKAISNNKGNIIIIVYFLPYLISLIIFIIKGINPLKIKLQKNMEKEENNTIKVKEPTEIKKSNFINIVKSRDKSKSYPPKKKSKKNKNSSNKKNKRKSLKKKEIKDKNEIKRKVSNIQILNKNINILTDSIGTNKIKNKISASNKNLLKNINSYDKSEKDNIPLDETKIEIEASRKLDDFELNELQYEEAAKYDQRTFLQIYYCLLKREHKIIFTYFIYSDYNLFYIKICRFMFLIASDMAMNALFFSDDSMHKLFLNYGKYDFFQQIPQIVYSTIVSQLTEVFLCFLSLTDKAIYKIKHLNQLNNKAASQIFRCIKIKLLFFFLFTTILFVFYWYMVSSFCSVYQNTQSAFIKDSLLSFLLSLLLPFVIYLIPSSLRICAIRDKKVRLKCIYKLSDIIPFF